MTDTYMRSERDAWECEQLADRIVQAEKERDLAIQQKEIAIAERDEALAENKRLENVIRANRTYFTGEIRKANQRNIQSVAKPLVVAAMCAVLFILAEIGVSADLVSVLVGEPIAYTALCVLFFCVGMIVDQLAKRKENGGKK